MNNTNLKIYKSLSILSTCFLITIFVAIDNAHAGKVKRTDKSDGWTLTIVAPDWQYKGGESNVDIKVEHPPFQGRAKAENTINPTDRLNNQFGNFADPVVKEINLSVRFKDWDGHLGSNTFGENTYTLEPKEPILDETFSINLIQDWLTPYSEIFIEAEIEITYSNNQTSAVLLTTKHDRIRVKRVSE